MVAPKSTHPPTLRLHPNSPELWGGDIRTTPKMGLCGNGFSDSTKYGSTEEPPNANRGLGAEKQRPAASDPQIRAPRYNACPGSKAFEKAEPIVEVRMWRCILKPKARLSVA